MSPYPLASEFFILYSQNFRRISGSNMYLSKHELEDLCTTCGLVDYTYVRNGRFIMIAARKPR
ncbi:hypothetical protein Hdeb2414_s0012g00389571 [Helianthus debilis subsp. tardiflorus]